jgi:hypothetical protein
MYWSAVHGITASHCLSEVLVGATNSKEEGKAHCVCGAQILSEVDMAGVTSK